MERQFETKTGNSSWLIADSGWLTANSQQPTANSQQPTANSLLFAIYILSIWRLSSLLVREEGPGDLFGKLRNKAGVKYDTLSRPYGETFIAKLLSCVYCVSLWISIIFVICDKLSRGLTVLLSLPLALSAGAIVVDTQVRRGT